GAFDVRAGEGGGAGLLPASRVGGDDVDGCDRERFRVQGEVQPRGAAVRQLDGGGERAVAEARDTDGVAARLERAETERAGCVGAGGLVDAIQLDVCPLERR